MDESIAGDGYWMGLGEDPQTGRQITSPGVARPPVARRRRGHRHRHLRLLGRHPRRPRATSPTPWASWTTWARTSAAPSACRWSTSPAARPSATTTSRPPPRCCLFLNGLAPLPEFDELGRPAWLFGETVHRHCPRAGYYEEGVFAREYGDKECLVELGCWGPVVQCNIAERGIVDGHGGCMQMGGICIGCTMPGFPDKFSPITEIAPGSLISSTTSRVVGGFIRRMRYMSRVRTRT